MATEEDIKKKEDDLIEKKEVAFYTAGVAAWYNTSIEHDKSLFTLSAGGIGLLITLIRTVGVPSAETLTLYIIAMLGFLVCLISVLVIFKKNRSHIEQVLQGRNNIDRSLAIFDNVAIWSFGIAVLFSAVIGVSSAISSYTTRVIQVAKENNNQASNVTPAFESIEGIANLSPSNLLKKSFNGVGALQPQSSASSTSSAQSQSATASTKKSE